MTPTFVTRLAERVGVTFVLAFVGTYVNVLLGAEPNSMPLAGQVGELLKGLENLSLLHKAVVAGGLALFQMAAGVLVAPHIGDPNTPDFTPKRFLRTAQHDAVPVGRYAASDELQHVLQQAAANNPTVPLTTQAVLDQVNAVKVPVGENPVTPAT